MWFRVAEYDTQEVYVMCSGQFGGPFKWSWVLNNLVNCALQTWGAMDMPLSYFTCLPHT